eukprot:TRINITY_DN1983_c0_g1_i2.p1 TRINITY_DN1983_c0_g1~~TRINITY_DN1983_c0_g1_i2.p1  ORF type:complete len:107 (+),score=19.37 TRINITY_DN1983_c0_g1_i2:248-568(+)
MRGIAVFLLVCCVGLSLGQLCPKDAAIEQKLKDSKFIQKQVKCILGTGKCNRLGGRLKRKVPEAIRGVCPKPCKPCDQKQIQRVIQVMQEKYPSEWASILSNYNGK